MSNIIKMPLARVITACVTPFDETGTQVDSSHFQVLCQHLISNGSEGLLVHGTTGEGPCLNLEEKKTLIRLARKEIEKSVKPIHLMAGIGGNDTQAVCEQVQALLSQDEKPDSLLVVVPYYNKPTQAGMLAHFKAVAQVSQGIPLVIYNIPNRTGVCMFPSTMNQLHDDLGHLLLGVKQSHPDLDQLSELTRLLPFDKTGFVVWAGDDSLTLPMLSLGAKGIISVASHLIGSSLLNMVEAFEQGKTAKALTLHHTMLPTMKRLFEVSNPILIKACMAQQGFVHPTMRLPMLLEPEHHEIAQDILQALQSLEI
jgi:4-hydroxy-tetrahydrodipicolinate synthase